MCGGCFFLKRILTVLHCIALHCDGGGVGGREGVGEEGLSHSVKKGFVCLWVVGSWSGMGGGEGWGFLFNGSPDKPPPSPPVHFIGVSSSSWVIKIFLLGPSPVPPSSFSPSPLYGPLGGGGRERERERERGLLLFSFMCIVYFPLLCCIFVVLYCIVLYCIVLYCQLSRYVSDPQPSLGFWLFDMCSSSPSPTPLFPFCSFALLFPPSSCFSLHNYFSL